MKLARTVLGWMAIALVVWFAVDYLIAAANNQTQQNSGWGIAKDSPLR
jgi:hypothetical protein